jgi:hypothetical protein
MVETVQHPNAQKERPRRRGMRHRHEPPRVVTTNVRHAPVLCMRHGRIRPGGSLSCRAPMCGECRVCVVQTYTVGAAEPPGLPVGGRVLGKAVPSALPHTAGDGFGSLVWVLMGGSTGYAMRLRHKRRARIRACYIVGESVGRGRGFGLDRAPVHNITCRRPTTFATRDGQRETLMVRLMRVCAGKPCRQIGRQADATWATAYARRMGGSGKIG